ncbi:rod shape-determining protein MreD [Adlercreutzia agrestimuris]|uniref:rod shape-determining protein MreD n=1 Tax=Adlercreutzia agrestimuris TaxID=2941324 RepID=UPI00203D23DB|nr:rod shape-determining protein MreD [Adlercreutzia agrestimuris]
MTNERKTIIVIVGALLSVVLQIVVAPAITLFSVQPNFMLAYALTVSIVCPHEAGPVLPFVLGLLYDLMGTGPVGAMALLFTLASFIASRVFIVVENDTLFMSLAILAGMLFGVEMCYGLILMLMQLPVSLADVFLYRALPCALYDCIVGLIIMVIMMHVLAGPKQDREMHISQL